MSSPSIGAYESIPELMRIARGSYAWAINARLAAEGIDDLPRNGAFALSYLARADESVVKQAVSQLLDTLSCGITSPETSILRTGGG